jgi:hypothetical protein
MNDMGAEYPKPGWPSRDLRERLDAAERENRVLRAKMLELRQRVADAMLWVPLETQDKLRDQWDARARSVGGAS